MSEVNNIFDVVDWITDLERELRINNNLFHTCEEMIIQTYKTQNLTYVLNNTNDVTTILNNVKKEINWDNINKPVYYTEFDELISTLINELNKVNTKYYLHKNTIKTVKKLKSIILVMADEIRKQNSNKFKY